MAELKTTQGDADVHEFINAATSGDEQKRRDSLDLLSIMEKASGFQPKIWGASIIGFGSYHYKSERSRQEGDWFLIGFSPRKTAISLYVYTGCSGQELLLKDLGRYKMGKSCIYIKKLSDIRQDTLESIMKSTADFLQTKHSKHHSD